MTIRQITDPSEKAAVSRAVLEALRDWFEVDESREAYIRESKDRPFFAAFDNGTPAGFPGCRISVHAGQNRQRGYISRL